MSKVTISTDEAVEAFCKMLEPGVKKGVLPPEDCNRYGIDVLRNKHDISMVMFHFVTLDMLEVNIELDMMELQRRGKEYLDHLYGLLCDQSEMARKERQEANTITIYNTGSFLDKENKKKQVDTAVPEAKKTASAVNEVLH